MRGFLGVVVALVVGIVLGAWQPRGEVLELRAKLDDARAQAAKDCRGSGLRQIQELLGAEAPGTEEGDGDDGRRVTNRRDGADAPPAPADGAPEGPPRDGPAMTPEQAREQVAAVQAALDARRAHALAALAEQGELDEAQMQDVERILDGMNDALKKEIDQFVSDALEHGEVERRDIMEFGANALDVVISTDDALRASIPEEQYDALDEEIADPLAYVSGEVVESLGRVASLPGFGAPQ